MSPISSHDTSIIKLLHSTPWQPPSQSALNRTKPHNRHSNCNTEARKMPARECQTLASFQPQTPSPHPGLESSDFNPKLCNPARDRNLATALKLQKGHSIMYEIRPKSLGAQRLQTGLQSSTKPAIKMAKPYALCPKNNGTLPFKNNVLNPYKLP